jgi:hypothetical protein
MRRAAVYNWNKINEKVGGRECLTPSHSIVANTVSSVNMRQTRGNRIVA